MDKIKIRLQEIGLISLIFIAAVVSYLLGRFFMATEITDKVMVVIHMGAALFGFFYAISGFSKQAAMNYKFFMFLYLVSSLVNTYEVFENKDFSTMSKVVCILGVVVSAILTFGKNLGKNKSVILTISILLLNIALLLVILVKGDIPFQTQLNGVENALLTAFVCIFVSAKYDDKDARGTI